MTRPLMLLALLTACATEAPTDRSPGDLPPIPVEDGKGDGVISCGTDACEPSLCGWDCAQHDSACARACTTELRADAFVAATMTGAVDTRVDSRATPYVPRRALDNVLIYGCELWSYSSGSQGLEIELTELVHAPFAVDGSDPARYRAKLDVYVPSFRGVGSYSGEGVFEANSDSEQYLTQHGCSVDVREDRGGVAGTFECGLAATLDAAPQTTMRGEFACPGNALDWPVFLAWQP